jgi:hypothetical protein
MSETESDDESPLTFEPLEKELKDMLEVLNETIESLEKVKKEVCIPHNLFEELHLKSLLHTHLMNWKAEGRLSQSGSTVRLTEDEAKEFHIPYSTEPVSIYTICCALVNLCVS